MKYLSTFEIAEKWGISPRRVGILCNQDRIPGAQRAGSRWIIPEDAEKQPMPALKAGNTEKKRGDLPMGQEYLPSDTPQQRLQDLMKEYKITQAELASKIGVAESSISRFLNGTKNKLTIEQIIRIARIFNVSSDFLLCLTNVPDKKNYDISELGLSAEAARNLYTGRVNPEVVSRLLENRRFAQLTSMIALYFDETIASGFAAQNQILQSLSSMLLMTGKEQPDIRKASQQAAQAVSLNKVPVFQADLSNIQNQFMAVLREIKKEMTSGEGISQNMTKELTEQMFSELTKGQDLHHPSVSPEQLAAMVVQPISQMGVGRG